MIHSRSGRCVVFDLDDTLYDEIDFVRSGFSAVADAVHARLDVDCRQMLDERLRLGELAGVFQAVVARYDLREGTLEFMLSVYRFHSPQIQPRDGVELLLTALKQRDGVLGCITDGRGRTRRNKIAALGLAQLFDVLLISEETGHSKPDPLNYQELMRRVDAREFWYVADNVAKDFVAPNALGWKTICVKTQRGVHQGRSRELAPEILPQVECELEGVLAVLEGKAAM